MSEHTHSQDDYAAYLGLRHFKPDAVRMIRLGLDNGVDFRLTAARLRKLGITGDEAAFVSGALRYMAKHPWVGRAVIVGGDEHYTWEELEDARMSNSLVGIEVHAGGRWKFIGKVGVCPDYPDLPALSRRRIFYREGSYKDNVSHAAQAFGVDCAAWEEAVRQGASIFVHWCTDTQQLLVVDRWTFEKKGFRLDLGEAPELRVKMKDVVVVDKAARVRLGYTTRTIKVGHDPERDKKPIQRRAKREASAQKGLFDG